MPAMRGLVRYWIIGILLGLMLLWHGVPSAYSQAASADRPPKLVIQLVLGGLPPSVLVRSWNNLTPNGIARLRAHGVECLDARYAHLLCNGPSGIATIASGTTPDVHGVFSNRWYNHVTGEKQYLTSDSQCHTVGDRSNGYQVSPHRLQVPTLGQAWRAAFPKARIYALSLDPQSAILLAGRTADAALWLSERSGHFVSSTYYCDSLPGFVSRFNGNGLAHLYLKQEWRLSRPSYRYTSLLRRHSPSHVHADALAEGDGVVPMAQVGYGEAYAGLAYRPQGNTLLRDLMLSAVEGERLGRGAEPDLLSVYYTPFETIAMLYGRESVQYEDALFRFDHELAQLLDYLDAAVGRQQYLLVLTSAYAASASSSYLQQWRIPGGQFSPDRAHFLMNAYLKARYGVGDLVLGHAGQQFFLDRLLMEQRGLSGREVEESAATFLQAMTGVRMAYPSRALQWGSGQHEQAKRAAMNYHATRSGEVLVDLQPGWSVLSERFPSAKSGESSYDSHVPLFFYGWKLPSRRVVSSVAPHDIAATICHLMQIAPPHASTGRPIGGIADWDK